MNLREKYLNAIKRRANDYVPFYFSLTPPQVEKFRSIYGNDNYEEKFKFPVRGVWVPYIGEKPKDKFKSYLTKWQGNSKLNVGEFGNVSIQAKDSHFAHYEAIMGDFDKIEDFEKYPYPNAEKDYDWSFVNKLVNEYHKKGLAAEAGLACTIFEIGWYMRGMENMLMDMYLEEELLSYHLDRITEIRCIMAARFVKAGVDVLQLGDDIATQRGMMMKPEMWRKFFKGRLSRVIQSARKVNPGIIIKYHTDGNPSEVIPDLIEIGIDILNPIQPECISPEYVKETYGDKLSMDGTLGTQSVFPFGTPEDVRKQCLKMIRACAYNGGLVIAPSHVIEPEVPWENIEAFVQAVNDFNDGIFK